MTVEKNESLNASCSLSASEENYSMIEKEAMAILFGIMKFHGYLFRRRFSLLTDHRPLSLLLGAKLIGSSPVLGASCNVGLYSCQLISMKLNTGPPRITPTLKKCLDCHDGKQWKSASRIIGAWKLKLIKLHHVLRPFQL